MALIHVSRYGQILWSSDPRYWILCSQANDSYPSAQADATANLSFGWISAHWLANSRVESTHHAGVLHLFQDSLMIQVRYVNAARIKPALGVSSVQMHRQHTTVS